MSPIAGTAPVHRLTQCWRRRPSSQRARRPAAGRGSVQLDRCCAAGYVATITDLVAKRGRFHSRRNIIFGTNNDFRKAINPFLSFHGRFGRGSAASQRAIALAFISRSIPRLRIWRSRRWTTRAVCGGRAIRKQSSPGPRPATIHEEFRSMRSHRLPYLSVNTATMPYSSGLGSS